MNEQVVKRLRYWPVLAYRHQHRANAAGEGIRVLTELYRVPLR
jgi:hypothetical protein